jgi:hypothetical protein
MMKAMHTVVALFGLALPSGCGRPDVATPRFAGTVVSRVDTYCSGTGVQSVLHRQGSMTSGFDYGDPSKADWTSDIKWHFLRRDGQSDVYRVEWTFRPEGGTGGTKTREVSFNGTQAVRVFDNQWQVISIEPGSMKTDSQHAPAADGVPPGALSSAASTQRS